MNSTDSELIKQLRKSRNLTQEQLGMLSGMSKSQISKMESGLLGSENTIRRLLDAMGFSVELKIVDKYDGVCSEQERVLDTLRSFKQYNSEKYGIESMALFGSFSRGEQKDNSDVDILISLKAPSLYLFSELTYILKAILKREVDLVSAKSRERTDFFNEISKDLIYV